MTSLLSPKFLVQTGYGIISILLYFTVCYVIVKNWAGFKGSFFRLYIVSFIINLWTYLNSFITLRLPQNTCSECVLSSIFRESFTRLNIFHTLHYQFAFLQYLLIMTACLNRCTMIFQPYTYEKVWRSVYFFVFIIIIFPFPITASLMTHYSYFEYVEAMDCFAIMTTLDVKIIYDVLIPFIIVVTLLTAIINITATLKLFTVNRTERRKSEINLFIMSLAHFLCQFSVATITVLVRLTVDDTNRESFWAQLGQLVLPFGSDFLTLSSPYLLIAFSSKLRNCIGQLINKHNNVTMIIASVY